MRAADPGDDPNDEHVACPKPHRGLAPCEMPDAWQEVDIDIWVVPQTLYFHSQRHKSRFGGTYSLGSKLGNHMPYWRRTSKGDVNVLYAGTVGKWIVGQGDIEGNFDTSVGFIRHPEEHKGALPHSMAGAWQLSDGRQWLDDTSIQISTTPVAAEKDLATRIFYTWQGGVGFSIFAAKLVYNRMYSAETVWDVGIEEVLVDISQLMMLVTSIMTTIRLYHWLFNTCKRTVLET